MVFQNPSFLGGFLAGEISLAGTGWKQACPKQPKTLRVPWVFVCPVVNGLEGGTAMAVCTPSPCSGFPMGSRCLSASLTPEGKKTSQTDNDITCIL